MIISFKTEAECQAEFDWLVFNAGVKSGASAKEKLAAVRGLSDNRITALLDGAVLIRPTWNADWFTALQPWQRLDELQAFPGHIRAVMIGSTKDETAAARAAWSSLAPGKLGETVYTLCGDARLADEVTSTYSLDSRNSQTAADGLVQLTTEAFFALSSARLGDLLPSVYAYEFAQIDTFPASACPNMAYHCLDLPFLFRLPAVAGDQADQGLRATSDALTEAVSTFVSGTAPWEPYHESKRTAIINDKGVTIRQDTGREHWRQFFDTTVRARLLVDLGRRLMTYRLDRRTQARIQ
jgi:carboxylesterase type B